MAADLRAGKAWDLLVGQFPEAVDRAWVAITSAPRRTDNRQHQLKGQLSTVVVASTELDQWQYEATAGARLWYAIDDAQRTLWLTATWMGHPKQTDRPRRRKR